MLRCIEGILLEPVGCLAEFPAEPFHEIAAQFRGSQGKVGISGSAAYWHSLTLMRDQPASKLAEALEIQAVTAASVYEDVRPALEELQAMGVYLLIASSLSAAAVSRFLELHSLAEFFSGVSNRENAGGIMAAPLIHALHSASVAPEKAIFLTDTLAGIGTARRAGVYPILMMNDPDESRRLAAHDPAGGLVSLHELPDFIRLVASQNSRCLSPRPSRRG